MKEKTGNRARLLHIQDAIALIFRFVQNKSEDEFAADLLLRSAIERQLEIIGEAVNRIEPDILALQPQISWRSIVGMRNILTHEYFSVQADLLWNVVRKELPKLLPAVEQLLILTSQNPD